MWEHIWVRNCPVAAKHWPYVTLYYNICNLAINGMLMEDLYTWLQIRQCPPIILNWWKKNDGRNVCVLGEFYHDGVQDFLSPQKRVLSWESLKASSQYLDWIEASLSEHLSTCSCSACNHSERATISIAFKSEIQLLFIYFCLFAGNQLFSFGTAMQIKCIKVDLLWRNLPYIPL